MFKIDPADPKAHVAWIVHSTPFSSTWIPMIYGSLAGAATWWSTHVYSWEWYQTYPQELIPYPQELIPSP